MIVKRLSQKASANAITNKDKEIQKHLNLNTLRVLSKSAFMPKNNQINTYKEV